MSDDAADPLRSCLAAYDAWASTYDTLDNPLIAQAAVALARHAAWFDGARVLELGCGTGRNAAWALAAGAQRFVGVDASPGMLAVARKRLADPRASWLEAELVRGASLATARGARFDVALICLVLEHVRDVGPVVAAAASALAPAGRLVVLELHPALHELGVGANFRLGDREVRLDSFRHTAEELVLAATAADLSRAEAADHVPSPEALARSAKLARYAGRPVLLELVAERALG
jgi:ubiquinone/menaquinone biosynthesis C-methylase UbiE